MPQSETFAAPLPGQDPLHGLRDLPQRADHQEEGDIGCRVVDRHRRGRDCYPAFGADGDVDVVVAGAVVADVFQRGRESRHKLVIEAASQFGGLVGTVDGDNVRVLTIFAVAEEV